MKTSDTSLVRASFSFICELHRKMHPSRRAENLVLRILGERHFAARGGGAILLKDLQIELQKRAPLEPSSAQNAIWRLKPRLKRFLHRCPPLPPAGFRWGLKEDPAGQEVMVSLIRIDERPDPQSEAAFLPEIPKALQIKFLKNPSTSTYRASSPLNGMFWEGIRIVHRAETHFGFRFARPAENKAWEFPAAEAQAAYDLERNNEWDRLQEEQRKKNQALAKQGRPPERIWDGRLWGVVASYRMGDAFVISLRRVRYRDAYFVSKYWKETLPGRLLRKYRKVRGFSEILDGTNEGGDTCPPVSLMRLGVLLWLPNSNQFVVTQTGSSPKLGLAGQGVCYSVMTPEERAEPKLDDQIARRLVEDIGLAIDLKHQADFAARRSPAPDDGGIEQPALVSHLAYVVDEKPSVKPRAKHPDHWIITAVRSSKTAEQIERIFEARRYGQFATKIRFVTEDELMAACVKGDEKTYDRALLLAACLFFERIKTATIEEAPIPEKKAR